MFYITKIKKNLVIKESQYRVIIIYSTENSSKLYKILFLICIMNPPSNHIHWNSF